MATGGEENFSPAYEIFRKHSADLLTVIQDPEVLAWELFAESVISSVVVEFTNNMIHERGMRTSKLLMAVESGIKVDPTAFAVFLSVLTKRPSMSDLCRRMKDAYSKSVGQASSATRVTIPVRVDPLESSGSSSKGSSERQQGRGRGRGRGRGMANTTGKERTVKPGLQSEGSIMTSEQPHPPHQPHQFCQPWPLLSSPRERPKTGILQPQEHTMQTHEIHQTPGVQLSAVNTYASYLKSVYTREKLPIYDKWPRVKSKKYINVALIEMDDITKPEAYQFMRDTIHGNIDDIKQSKRATDIGQIAQLSDGSQPKCILVEGAPGIGKSTFAWKLCRKWGKQKLLQQFQLVVLLRLRDKSVRAANKISDLFRYHQRHIQQAAVEEIQDTGGKRVLLLFEGYDELPEELRTESSVFLDVITGRELPEATVLITSCPWASEFLHRECNRHISQHIEILGFTKAHIQSYLESTIPDDPSLLADLKKYISCYPHIGSLMYIPLNSAIVVEVYRNSRKEETLVPKTMTELYSSLFRSLLLRHLLDHPVHGKKRRWRVSSFDDLPQDVHQQLCELGKIAFEGILHDQQVIFSDLPEDFETLGLMQCAPELYADEGAAVSYNFLHLTVQEYLAAFHLSQQPVEKQIEHFKKFKDHERQYKGDHDQQKECLDYHKHQHFHMVLWFLSGLRKFSDYPNDVLNSLCIEKSDDSGIVIFEVTFNTLHWLFEAHDSDVIAKLLSLPDIQLHEHSSQVTPFDCFVLGYCVSHSNCTWTIDLSRCEIGDEGVELLLRGAIEEKTHCTGNISKIDLSVNDITSAGLLYFPQWVNRLETLNLTFDEFNLRFCGALTLLVQNFSHLKELSLFYNPIGPGGAVLLVTSLTAQNSLEKLCLNNTGIGVEDCQALSELLSSSTSLKELNISWNALSPEAVELVISGLYHSITLDMLWVWGSQFSLQNTISLASVLRTNHTLVDLNLDTCGIDSDGACQLASALCTNDTLQKLSLDGNSIGVKGATAFAEMLRTNRTLVYLNIGHCNIESDGACQLASVLHTNDTLQKLYLDGNSIGVKGATAIAEILRANHTLVHIDFRHCKIDSDGGCQLASALSTNDALQKLYLEGNSIGVEGTTAFAKMLLKNKTLKVLELSDYCIGEEGTQKLIDSLTHNTTLEELILDMKYKSSVVSSVVDSRVIFTNLCVVTHETTNTTSV